MTNYHELVGQDMMRNLEVSGMREFYHSLVQEDHTRQKIHGNYASRARLGKGKPTTEGGLVEKLGKKLKLGDPTVSVGKAVVIEGKPEFAEFVGTLAQAATVEEKLKAAGCQLEY